MTEATVIVRVEDELKAAFAKAAKAADRTTSQLLRDFMRDYVGRQTEQADYDAWLRQKVADGRAAVQEGRMTSGEDVEADFAQRRARSSRRADKAGL